jgi:DnaJ-class molecular chaperone
MFSHIFGGGGGPPRRQKAPRGPNKHHDIGLSLRDFYNGKEIKLKFNQARVCSGCNGSGAEKSEPCGQCGASGFRTITRQIGPGMMAQSRMPCDGCGGEGKRVIRACGACHGKRLVEREKALDIKITPGMRDGQTLTFSGECSDSLEFERPGDVVLALRRSDVGVGDLDEFEWSGDDLTIRKAVSYAESILGFTIALDKHPGGPRSYCWRDGPLIHGAVLKFEGGGMPRSGGGFGALYIQVMVSPPPCVPWSPEDAAKLSSVCGGAVSGYSAAGDALKIASAESKLVVDRA